MDDKKRAWLYCQTCRSEYADAILEVQVLELNNFAERKGCTVVGRSKDACSGRYLDRPGLTQMLEAAQHNQFDVLLVTQYENLCCDMAMMTTCICQLQALGLDICSSTMGSVKNYNAFCVDESTVERDER